MNIPCMLLALVVLPQARTGTDAETSLCPSTWEEGTPERYLELNRSYGKARAGVEGTQAMIGGTSGAFAIHAGFQALERGGSAMDAALTTALAQTTLVAGSWVSFAGIAYIVYYDAATGEVLCLNAGYNTVAAEEEPASIPRQPAASGRTALVPGFMAGVERAHQKFGRMPFANLFEPAIYLAENGFPVDDAIAGLLASKQEVLSRREATRAVFQNQDGEFLGAGDVLKQPALAATLRAVAKQGAAYMYQGEWAHKMVQAVQEEGGHLALEDLAAYEVEWEQPTTTSYHDFDVFTVPPPELGTTMVLEGLNLLENLGIEEEPHYTTNPEMLYRFIQVCRLSYLISFSPGFGPYAAAGGDLLSPLERITKQHSDTYLDLFEAEDWNRSWETKVYSRLGQAGASRGGSHSDGVVAVDAEGNVCALVHSINTTSWGTTGIFVDGVSIPDSAAFQQDMIGRVGPGRRLPNITNPLLVLQEGRPVLAASVIGSALHECMLQNLVNILDFGMDPQESVNQPKFWGPAFDEKNALQAGGMEAQNLEQRLGEAIIDAVIDRGQKVIKVPAGNSYFVGIRLGEDGLSGGGTQRFNGIFEAR